MQYLLEGVLWSGDGANQLPRPPLELAGLARGLCVGARRAPKCSSSALIALSDYQCPFWVADINITPCIHPRRLAAALS